MGSGLQKQLVPIFVGKGIDTKLDPRLVPEGSLLTLENMYMLRTGELRLRNGFSKLAISLGRMPLTADNLFALTNGGLGTIARQWITASQRWPMVLKYGSSGYASWETNVAGSVRAFPSIKAKVDGVVASVTTSQATDLTECDGAVASGVQMVSYLEDTSTTGLRVIIKDASTDKIVKYNQSNQFGLSPTGNGRPAIVCAGGSSFLCVFQADNSGTPSLMAGVFTVSAGAWSAVATIVLNGVSAAQPWIDVKPIPGGNLIAVAYRASAGGVTCGIFNPATGAFTSTVNTAGADASFCLGWLDDSLATGNMYLATAGSGSGVVVRTMSATTMVVSATNVIDATATANIRNITGHINTGATDYAVFWDVSGTSAIYDKIRVGRWTGAAVVADIAPSLSLYGRSTKHSNGSYYALGVYASTVNPTYFLVGLENFQLSNSGLNCAALAGECGGRRVVQNSLSSPFSIGSTTAIAVVRKRQISTPSGVPFTQGRVIQRISFSDILNNLRRPRELGGTLFIPGGVLFRDDGLSSDPACFPLYPEALTGVSSATGSMTASGTYVYRAVYKRQDSTGRITRSAGSIPLSITLGAGDGRVTLTAQNPRIVMTDGQNLVFPYYTTVEFYRAGPAAVGDTGYNKIGETYTESIAAGDTLTFIDSMSDANSELGEAAYFSGNTLENFPPPSHNLLEVCNNRVGVVNAEDPTEFWPSKEYKAGTGIGFNPLLKIAVTGDNYGAITALAAMDGRWILFKSQAIYVISGDGPNDLGQGSFNPPQAVSLSIGTVLPGSVVATPDGIMFQSANGIYLLTRGLAVQYIGAPVEKYTLAENVVDASLVTGVTQVRFVTASGRCLVWDYHHQRWYTFQLRVDSNGVASTVVACANSSQLGWCYALADGNVMQETPGVFSDVNGTTTAIVPSIGFPQVNAGGIAGFQRCYGVLLEGEFVGNHTLQVSAILDLGTVTEPTRSLAITTGPYLYEVMFANQKCTTIQVNLTCTLAAGSGAFRLSGVSLIVGLKRGNGIPYTKRLV